MKEDRYLCLGLNTEQKKFIKDNIDKNYFARTISIEQMYYTLCLNKDLFKDCVVTKDERVIVQRVIGR